TEKTDQVAWGDYNGDGLLDLAIGNDGGTGQHTRVYKNNGDGTFTSVWTSAEADTTYSVAWGDFNGDGQLDLATAGYGQAKRVYKNNGDGTFTLQWSSVETDNSRSIAWGDYNGDGLLDL